MESKKRSLESYESDDEDATKRSKLNAESSENFGSFGTVDSDTLVPPGLEQQQQPESSAGVSVPAVSKDIEFRFLISNKDAGSVIGRGDFICNCLSL